MLIDVRGDERGDERMDGKRESNVSHREMLTARYACNQTARGPDFFVNVRFLVLPTLSARQVEGLKTELIAGILTA